MVNFFETDLLNVPYTFESVIKVNIYEDLYIDFGENLVNIAELLGSSYRHLLRTFNTLCKKGVFIKENGIYKIINKPLLEELAGDLYQDAKFMQDKSIKNNKIDKLIMYILYY